MLPLTGRAGHCAPKVDEDKCGAAPGVAAQEDVPRVQVCVHEVVREQHLQVHVLATADDKVPLRGRQVVPFRRVRAARGRGERQSRRLGGWSPVGPVRNMAPRLEGLHDELRRRDEGFGEGAVTPEAEVVQALDEVLGLYLQLGLRADNGGELAHRLFQVEPAQQARTLDCRREGLHEDKVRCDALYHPRMAHLHSHPSPVHGGGVHLCDAPGSDGINLEGVKCRLDGRAQRTVHDPARVPTRVARSVGPQLPQLAAEGLREEVRPR